MTKSELVNYYAERNQTTKRAATEIVENMFDTISEVLANGNNVAISGFGNFEVKEKAARKGRNPKTGEEISIPAKKSVSFKAGKVLKETVN